MHRIITIEFTQHVRKRVQQDNNKTEETRQKLFEFEHVLDLDDDDLVRRPRAGHVATQTVGVRKNRRTVANSG